jgi:hypothetical protein
MHLVGYDVEVWSVATTDLIAELREIRINTSREFIDVSGINQMPMPYYRPGEVTLEVTATQLINETPAFSEAILDGTEVYVQFNWKTPGGSQIGLAMYAYCGTDNINFAGRSEVVTEEVSFRPSRVVESLIYVVT